MPQRSESAAASLRGGRALSFNARCPCELSLVSPSPRRHTCPVAARYARMGHGPGAIPTITRLSCATAMRSAPDQYTLTRNADHAETSDFCCSDLRNDGQPATRFDRDALIPRRRDFCACRYRADPDGRSLSIRSRHPCPGRKGPRLSMSWRERRNGANGRPARDRPGLDGRQCHASASATHVPAKRFRRPIADPSPTGRYITQDETATFGRDTCLFSPVMECRQIAGATISRVYRPCPQTGSMPPARLGPLGCRRFPPLALGVRAGRPGPPEIDGVVRRLRLFKFLIERVAVRGAHSSLPISMSS